MARIAMLGTGFIGMFYTQTLRGNRSRDQVVTVYSRTAERTEKFARLKLQNMCFAEIPKRRMSDGKRHTTVFGNVHAMKDQSPIQNHIVTHVCPAGHRKEYTAILELREAHESLSDIREGLRP